jgi:hypothetical protein
MQVGKRFLSRENGNSHRRLALHPIENRFLSLIMKNAAR